MPVGSGTAVQVSLLPTVLAHALVGMWDLALYLAEPDFAWLTCLQTCCMTMDLPGDHGAIG